MIGSILWSRYIRRSAVGMAAMVNCIGDLPEHAPLLELEGVHLHLYGKAAKPGRKIGHVTVREGEDRALQTKLDKVRAVLGEGDVGTRQVDG